MRKHFISTMLVNALLLLFGTVPCYSQTDSQIQSPKGIYAPLYFVNPNLESNCDAQSKDGGHIFFKQTLGSFTLVGIEYDNPSRKFYGLADLTKSDIVDGKEVYKVHYKWGQMVTLDGAEPKVEPVLMHSPMEYKSDFKIPAGKYNVVSPSGLPVGHSATATVSANGTVTITYISKEAFNIPAEPGCSRAGGGRGITKVSTYTGGYPVVINGMLNQSFSYRYQDGRIVKINPTGNPTVKFTTGLHKETLAETYYGDRNAPYPQKEDMILYNQFMRDKDQNHYVVEEKKKIKESLLGSDFKVFNRTYKILGVTDKHVVLCTTTGDEIFFPGSYRILTKSDDTEKCERDLAIGESWLRMLNELQEAEKKAQEEAARREEQMKEMQRQREEQHKEETENMGFYAKKTFEKLEADILAALRMPGYRRGDDARSFEVESYNDAWNRLISKFFNLDSNNEADFKAVNNFIDMIEHARTFSFVGVDSENQIVKMKIVNPKRKKKILTYEVWLKYQPAGAYSNNVRFVSIDVKEPEEQKL